MADSDGIGEYDPRPNAWEVNEVVAERNTLAVQLRECRVARDLAEAERDRFRVIVDLACAEHELAFTVAETTLGTPEREWTFKAHRSAYGALRDAVAVEVARRAAL